MKKVIVTILMFSLALTGCSANLSEYKYILGLEDMVNVKLNTEYDVNGTIEIVDYPLNVDIPKENYNKTKNTFTNKFEMDDKWYNLQIVIDDIQYNYPYSYYDFGTFGWDFNTDNYDFVHRNTLDPYDIIGTILPMYNKRYGYDLDSFKLVVGFENKSTEYKKYIKDCYINSIDISTKYGSTNIKHYPNIILSRDITFGSTEEDIVEVYGTPTITDELVTYKVLEYEKELDNYIAYMTLYIDREIGLYRITLSSY